MFLDEMTKYLGRWNAVDVEEVGYLLVRCRPTRHPHPNQLRQEMLKPVSEPSRLLPDAPNRPAVAVKFCLKVEPS